MDTIKKQILNGFKKIGEFVDNCIHKANQRAVAQQQMQQVQLKQAQQQQQHNMIMAIMCEIARELFEAWGGVTYPNLQTIRVVQDIRPAYYRLNKNGICEYTYKLLKSTDKKLTSYQCDAIMRYMNTDIQRTRLMLINTYGLEYVETYFPYLAKGITVIKVQDTGLDVDVTVIV